MKHVQRWPLIRTNGETKGEFWGAQPPNAKPGHRLEHVLSSAAFGLAMQSDL